MPMDVKLRDKSGKEIVVLISHWENVLKKQGQYEVVDDGRNPKDVLETLKAKTVEPGWPQWADDIKRDVEKDNPEWFGKEPEAPEKVKEKKITIKKGRRG